jgi:hypothetical protein
MNEGERNHLDRHDRLASFAGRHGFALLFFTLLVFLLLVPIVHQIRQALEPGTSPILEQLIFMAVLAAAVISVSHRRSALWLSLGLAVPTAVLGMVHVFFGTDWIAVVRHLFGVSFLAYVIAMLLACIFASRRVTFNTVCASLCVYLLMGILWSLAYSLIDLFDPAAFYCSLPGGQPSPVLHFGRAGPSGVLYFSFTTLTSLGYGDIVPTSPGTRMLATTEAIAGQLYLAVLVARLVGLHIAESLAQEKAREPRER